jgi:hypothetical protein
MTAPRPSLEELASRLYELDFERLDRIVRARILLLQTEELPKPGRDEDPTDVFIDLADWLRRRDLRWTRLDEVCARLADEWAGVIELRTEPQYVGELHFLCARVGAVDARRGIARVIRRDDLRGVLLPSGEGLQQRSLRCLAGLLALVSPGQREEYLGDFAEALAVPQHLPIALTALAAFDPERREGYIARARERWPLHVGRILDDLERNVALLRAEMR